MKPSGEGRGAGRARKGSPVRVYKLGGAASEDASLLAALAREIRGWRCEVLLVHGGGKHVDQMLKELMIESHFSNGRRQTSAAAMDVVEMVLSGVVNKSLAAALTSSGVPAAGISGRDAGLLKADLVPALGRVGTRVRVNPNLVLALWAAGMVPVVSRSPRVRRVSRSTSMPTRLPSASPRPSARARWSTSPTSTAFSSTAVSRPPFRPARLAG